MSSLERRLRKLEERLPQAYCPWTNVIYDFGPGEEEPPVEIEGERMTVEEYEHRCREHSETCPVCQRAIQRGEARVIDFRPPG